MEVVADCADSAAGVLPVWLGVGGGVDGEGTCAMQCVAAPKINTHKIFNSRKPMKARH